MVATLDLNFLDEEHLTASYLLQGEGEVALVESGPGSTLPQLEKALAAHGLKPEDVNHVFLTHIHLDHAGGAGWLARRGATVYVHERGARHLLDPSRLWASATRIYGADNMAWLWGEMLPVPDDKLVVLQDGETIQAAGRTLTALDTPGHAKHHFAYLTDEGDCFTGDVGACTLPGYTHVRLPTPPPDLDVEAWDQSLQRLLDVRPARLFPTHFGAVTSPLDHLRRTRDELHNLTVWMQERWDKGAPRDQILAAYVERIEQQASDDGVDEAGRFKYQRVAGAPGCVDGYQRYLKKQEEKQEKKQEDKEKQG